MKVLNEDTPTGQLIEVKIGDQISNGLGTFGQVEEIKFDSGDGYWEFTFVLVGGGLIQVKKIIPTC